MKNLFLITFLCFNSILYGQNFHSTYHWSEFPKISQLPDSLQNEPSLTLKDLTCVEFVIDQERKTLLEFYTTHLIYRVNTEESIEKRNRVYIPLRSGSDLVEAQARVVKPNGEIIKFNKENIKTSEDLGEEGRYTFFAIEGAVKGAEIEILYTTVNNPRLNGRLLNYQKNEWSLNNELLLITPPQFTFAFKTYGNFSDPVVDTTDYKSLRYTLKSDTLPPLYEEEFSLYSSNLARVLYKLNSSNGQSNVVNYGNVAENYWNNTHPELTKTEQKKINKILDNEIKLKSNMSVTQKIERVEDYVKTNYISDDQFNNSDLDQTLTNKYTDDLGITILYCALLDAAEIPYKLGLTCDRSFIKFDKKFEAHNFLSETFIYFPEIKDFVFPDLPYSRLGLVPDMYTENYGLFVENVIVGDYSTAVGKIDFIAAEPAEATVNIIDLSIDFRAEIQNPSIEFTRSFTGYTAENLQPYYSLMEEEDKQNLGEDLMKLPNENAEVLEFEVFNTDMADVNKKPLIYKGKIEYPEVIEKAGDKYLFRIGELIGPQVPLYQDKKRQTPIENDHNRTYLRTIKALIPKGYSVENLEALEFDIEVLEGTALFKSSYTYTEDELIVDIEEVYRQINYPIEDYEAFKTVVNAAANFNKIVLMLIPTN